jgi:hypothetical protein
MKIKFKFMINRGKIVNCIEIHMSPRNILRFKFNPKQQRIFYE